MLIHVERGFNPCTPPSDAWTWRECNIRVLRFEFLNSAGGLSENLFYCSDERVCFRFELSNKLANPLYSVCEACDMQKFAIATHF